jgi:hypothetical protein
MAQAQLDGLDTGVSMEGTMGQRDRYSKMHHKNVRMVTQPATAP